MSENTSKMFYPNENLKQNAHIKSMEQYSKIQQEFEENYNEKWLELARENLEWFKKPEVSLSVENAPFYKWFEDWKINLSYECIDANLDKYWDKVAIIFEAEDWTTKKITYKELSREVNKTANLLKKLWIKKGDRVALYMPMILESVYAMLACARIWAVHNVVFGGFSAWALKERIISSRAKLVITADGAYRKWQAYNLKNTVDEALEDLEDKPKVLVVKRNNIDIEINKNDYIYNDLINSQEEECIAEKLSSEDLLFLLYTSGSTGKPKWVKHSTWGYALWAKLTTKWAFDLQEWDVFWCSADIGWITGHTYSIYWPLLNWWTTVIYEGVPTYPDVWRVWEIIEKYKINKFYTAPTLIRLLYKLWKNLPQNYDLSSLKILGTVWEPINPEAWKWFYEKVWQENCPIIDTWWQTETGGHMIAPLPAVIPTIPGVATLPMPWIMAKVLDKNGEEVSRGEKGLLCITKPWPSMLRWVWQDDEKFVNSYFSEVKVDWKPVYFSWDGAIRLENDYIKITGRTDDVINVSGHRIGTAEVEDVISKVENVAECSVVWREDKLTWENIFWFIVVKNIIENKDELLKQINLKLRKEIGPIVKLDDLLIIEALPKTRSGKIMRRLLRSITRWEKITADISTLENPNIIQEIENLYKKNG